MMCCLSIHRTKHTCSGSAAKVAALAAIQARVHVICALAPCSRWPASGWKALNPGADRQTAMVGEPAQGRRLHPATVAARIGAAAVEDVKHAIGTSVPGARLGLVDIECENLCRLPVRTSRSHLARRLLSRAARAVAQQAPPVIRRSEARLRSCLSIRTGARAAAEEALIDPRTSSRSAAAPRDAERQARGSRRVLQKTAICGARSGSSVLPARAEIGGLLENKVVLRSPALRRGARRHS